jgi:hypothetical protein
MTTRFIFAVLLIAVTQLTLADEPMLGPAIEGYGPTYPIDDRDVPLEEGVVYRAVFDAASYSDDLGALNSRLVSVARFLNMHVRNDTPVENMDLAVVLHGAAVKNANRIAKRRLRAAALIIGTSNPAAIEPCSG